MAGKFPNQTCIEFETFHKLTWKQRLKLLFGWNILVNASVLIHHRNGTVKSKADLRLTTNLTATEQVRSNVTEEPS